MIIQGSPIFLLNAITGRIHGQSIALISELNRTRLKCCMVSKIVIRPKRHGEVSRGSRRFGTGFVVDKTSSMRPWRTFTEREVTINGRDVGTRRIRGSSRGGGRVTRFLRQWTLHEIVSATSASRGRQEPNREIRATGESETERGLSLGDKLPKRTNKIIRYGECDVGTRDIYEEIEE